VKGRKGERQLAFGLTLPESEVFAIERFFPGKRNDTALLAVKRFCEGGAASVIVLVGPRKSGKSHLLKAIALQSGEGGAYIRASDFYAKSGPLTDREFNRLARREVVCVDDLETAKDLPGFYDRLFHLFNRLADRGGRMAVAMSRSPAGTGFLPDYLSSRLLTGMVVNLKRPDETARAQILKKLAADRQISLTPQAVRYVLQRAPRSVERLKEIVALLDETALAGAKRIGLQHIRSVLESLG